MLLATGLHLLVLRKLIIWWLAAVLVAVHLQQAVVALVDFLLAQHLLSCRGLRMLFL
jgi:hypothetical protein